LASIDVATYGISITTLEDVFLNVGHLANPLDALDATAKESSQEIKSQWSKKGTPEFCFGTSVNQNIPVGQPVLALKSSNNMLGLSGTQVDVDVGDTS